MGLGRRRYCCRRSRRIRRSQLRAGRSRDPKLPRNGGRYPGTAGSSLLAGARHAGLPSNTIGPTDTPPKRGSFRSTCSSAEARRQLRWALRSAQPSKCMPRCWPRAASAQKRSHILRPNWPPGTKHPGAAHSEEHQSAHAGGQTRAGSRCHPLAGSQQTSLAALKGHPVLLFFWAHWCSDCKAEAPILARLMATYGPKGLVLVAPTQLYGYTAAGEVAPDAENRYIGEVWRQFYGVLGNVPVPIGAQNFLRYGCSTTPTLVLLDRGGVVRLYHPGAMTYDALANKGSGQSHTCCCNNAAIFSGSFSTTVGWLPKREWIGVPSGLPTYRCDTDKYSPGPSARYR